MGGLDAFLGPVTLASLVFCVGRMRDPKPVKLPLFLAIALFLIACRLSLWHTYDLDTSWLEFWGWAFTVLIFYLFINVAESAADVNHFFALAGLIVIPLAVHCIWQRISLSVAGGGHCLPRSGLFGYGLLEIPLTQQIHGSSLDHPLRGSGKFTPI